MRSRVGETGIELAFSRPYTTKASIPALMTET